MANNIFLVEFTALIDATGTPQIFRFSSSSQFMTLPTDTPPNTAYPAYLDSPGQYERHCWSRGATRGTSTRGFGVIKFLNSDGAFDPVLNYGLDGQPVKILFGPDGGSYPSAFTTLFTGVAYRGQFPSRTEFDVVLVDRQGDAADFTFQLTKFLGTNIGASGLEGLITDLQGKPKPNLRGTAYNFQPPCVNTTNLIYQIDDGTAITPMTVIAVYDKRLALTAGTVYTPGNLATFLSTAPSGGTYSSYYGPEGWYIRTGSAPVGTLTVSASEGALANRTVAQICSRIASQQGGLPLSQMSGISALDGLKPYECGVWIGSETTVGQVLDQVLDSANAYMTDSRSGVIQFGCLQDPAAMTPVTTVYDWMVKDEAAGYTVTGTNDSGVGLRLSSNWDGTAQRYASSQDATLGLPVWRVLCLYGLNNTVMSATDLTSGYSQSDLAYVQLQYRTQTAANANVLKQHRKAPEYTATTVICQAADAATEAAAQLALRSVPRYCYVIPLDPGQIDATGKPVTASIDLGSCFTLVSSRFGLANGKNLLCIGIAEDFGDPTTPAISTIYAWG